MSDTEGELATAIGRLCIEWSRLEESVRFAVLLLSDTEHFKLLAMTAHINLKELMDMVRALMRLSETSFFREHQPEREAELDSIANRIDKLRVRRNKFVHGIYEIRDGAMHQYEKKARGELTIDFSPVSTTEIEVLIGDIAEVQTRLRQVLDPLYTPDSSQ